MELIDLDIKVETEPDVFKMFAYKVEWHHVYLWWS